MEIRVQSLKFDADQKLLAYVDKKVSKLAKFFDGVDVTDVTLSLLQEPDNKSVKIQTHIPGEDLIIERNAKTFEEAGELVNHLMAYHSLVMTLNGIPTESARRLLDFMSGITFALQGKITPISAKTYFISPEHVDLLGAQPDGAETDGQYL